MHYKIITYAYPFYNACIRAPAINYCTIWCSKEQYLQGESPFLTWGKLGILHWSMKYSSGFRFASGLACREMHRCFLPFLGSLISL